MTYQRQGLNQYYIERVTRPAPFPSLNQHSRLYGVNTFHQHRFRPHFLHCGVYLFRRCVTCSLYSSLIPPPSPITHTHFVGEYAPEFLPRRKARSDPSHAITLVRL